MAFTVSCSNGFHSLRMCWWKKYFFLFVLNLFLENFIHVLCERADCSMFTISFAIHHTPSPPHPQGSSQSCRATEELPREVRYTACAEKIIGIFLLVPTFLTKYLLYTWGESAGCCLECSSSGLQACYYKRIVCAPQNSSIQCKQYFGLGLSFIPKANASLWFCCCLDTCPFTSVVPFQEQLCFAWAQHFSKKGCKGFALIFKTT